jgi:hypothetical protein
MQVDAAANLGMLRKHGYRRADLLKRLRGGIRRSGEKKFHDPVEIVERLVRID